MEHAGQDAEERRYAILGAGNLGTAIAGGLVRSERVPPARVTLTRRRVDRLAELEAKGHPVTPDNVAAAREANVLVLCVQPQQLDEILQELRPALDEDRHVLVSTVSGASIASIRNTVGPTLPVVRAMPNLGARIWESMTCLAADAQSEGALPAVEEVFDGLGVTARIDEDQVNPATALCACGVAFFLRAIRAAAQGGIEIGFHADDAIRMAAQTAKGAAELVLTNGSHPETEIDNVTTPTGCTIAGLNDLENRGFSSALIGGITTSSRVASDLYAQKEEPAPSTQPAGAGPCASSNGTEGRNGHAPPSDEE